MPNRSKVGDFVSLQRGITYKGNLKGKPGPALLGLGSIHPGGGFREGDYKTYGGDCPDKIMLFPGDLFASLKGATKDGEMIGSVAKLPASVKTGRLTQDTVKLVFHTPNEEERDFLYWVLRTPQYRAYCGGRATGSAVVAMSRDDFLNFPVPTITPERLEVVELLETIHHKIELNRRMNATLEGMAQALFKSWFVDFDPVIDNALAARNPIPDELADRAEVRRQALATGTANRDAAKAFPAAFQQTETMGWIPVGWEVSTIGEECDTVGGGTPSTSNSEFWKDGEYHWVTPKDFSTLNDKVLLSSSRFLTKKGLDKVSSGLLPIRTVLMSSRAPVGYLAITQIETAINQGFIAMICNKKLPPEYILQWANSRMEDIKQASSGSTFAEISKKAFRPFEIIVPDSKSLELYSKIAATTYLRISDGVAENNTLTDLRDSLLPKLISGDLGLNVISSNK